MAKEDLRRGHETLQATNAYWQAGRVGRIETSYRRLEGDQLAAVFGYGIHQIRLRVKTGQDGEQWYMLSGSKRKKTKLEKKQRDGRKVDFIRYKGEHAREGWAAGFKDGK